MAGRNDDNPGQAAIKQWKHISHQSQRRCIQPGDFIENKAQTQESTERENWDYITHDRVHFGVCFTFLVSNLLLHHPQLTGVLQLLAKLKKPVPNNIQPHREL